MSALNRRLFALAIAASVVVAGCADHGVVAPSFTFDRQAFYESLAHPMVSDWSSSRLTSSAVDQLRAQPAKARAAQRRIQNLATVTSFSSAGVNATASTGKVSCAPGYSYYTNEAYWLTETGWFIKRNMSTNVVSAVQISATDSFAGTSLTVSSDGLKAYAVSRQGRFFAFLTTTGAQLSGSPYAMGGTSALITANSCAPAIDPLASRDDGQIETVYALTATGTLHRFYVNAPHNQAANTWSLTRAQAYALPVNNTAPYTEVFRANPVVINGKVVVGSWRSNSGNAAQDNGSMFYYDTGLNGIPASATATSTVGANKVVSVPSPIWAAAAVEFDDSLTPVYAFAPTGYVVSMIDLATGTRTQTASLLTTKNTASQGGPASGTLDTYPYGGTVATPVTKSPVANGLLAIADTNTATDLSGTWRELNNIYAAVSYDNTRLYPIWGYVKFLVTDADVTVGGSVRAIVQARVLLDCNSSSNQNGNANPAPDPVQMFRVSNTLTNGTAWDSTNITPATRPAFEDGRPFSQANLNSHAGVELTNAGNAFKNNQTYAWGATGLVSSTNVNYTFGLASQDLSYVNSASNNGQPARNSTPRFGAARLEVTPSSAGLTTPTMTTPVTIDSWNKRVFAVNTNTLYTASYASATYDATATPFVAASLAERFASLSDSSKTYFALTNLGKSQGPVSGTSFVANDTAPLFTGSSIYVFDHYPGNNSSSLNRFSVASPPALQADIVTTSGSTNATRGATYLTYDTSGRIYAGTYDNTANGGRCWVVSQ